MDLSSSLDLHAHEFTADLPSDKEKSTASTRRSPRVTADEQGGLFRQILRLVLTSFSDLFAVNYTQRFQNYC
jgi:hypothetical protein